MNHYPELIRYGFADYDTLGHGLIAQDHTGGRLDAPHWMPQGSMRRRNGLVVHSLANRDVLAGHAGPGVGSDS